jgi:hypothetical protein
MTGTTFGGSFCLLMLSIGSVGDGLEGARYARQGRVVEIGRVSTHAFADV